MSDENSSQIKISFDAEKLLEILQPVADALRVMNGTIKALEARVDHLERRQKQSRA